MTDNERLVRFLQERQLELALAESMTCGLAAHKLSTVKDVSEVLMGSVVCYDAGAKTSALHVPQTMIKKYTAESQQVTDALARKLPELIKADIHAAITGLASPGGSETKEKPVGTVFFSVRYKNKMYRLRRLFRGSPLEIRNKACDALYRFIYDMVKKNKKLS